MLVPDMIVENGGPSMHRNLDNDDRKSQQMAWIGQAKTGDQEALGRLIATCHDYLMSVARLCIPQSLRSKFDPADLVQETALDAHRGISMFDGETIEQLCGWLRKTLIHNSATIRRRFVDAEKRAIWRECSSPVDEYDPTAMVEPQPTASGIASAAEECQRLVAVIERLPEDMRLVLLLRNRDGLKFAEIGERMNRSGDAARKLWSRAVEQLSTELCRDGKH